MTVKEVKQSYGSWEIYLRDYTPREILDAIQANPFGHIAIVPGRINPKEYGDGMLALARYVGVFRAFFNQPDDQYEIKGTGMAFWLGDEDDKGDIYEAPVTLTNETFANTIRGLLPAGGAVIEGTLHTVPGGQLYTGTHQHQSPRKALTYVTETFSTISQPVEWRVNGDGTLDAGPVANLYQTNPRAILVEKEAGRELALVGLQATLSNDYDIEDYTTRVVLLGQGEGAAVATGSADAPPTPYKDIHGNPVKMTRLISESVTSGVNADVRAEVELNRFQNPRRAAQISTDEYDVKGEFVVGDYIYVFDPDGGYYDLNNEAFWKGVPINPIKLRVIEMTWPIRANWTVAFRTNLGDWIDLSEYYRPEAGGTNIAVGDFLRTLAGGGGTEPVNSRPAPDESIPAAPVFGPFSTGSYQSLDDNWTKSAILATWTQPLNLDGSTITDGDHYEIRYRVNAFKGYGIRWGILAGYPIGTDNFTRSLANSWGNLSGNGLPWTNIGGSANDFDVNGAQGTHTLTSVNVARRSVADTVADGEIVIEYTVPVLLTTDGIDMFNVVRYVDANNFLAIGARANADATVSAIMFKTVGGVLNFVDGGAGGTISGMTHTAGATYNIRVRFIGSSLKLKVWQSPGDEPSAWNIETTDSSILSAGGLGPQTMLRPFNANTLPVIVSIDNVWYYETVAGAPGYRWGDLAGNKWGAPISEPVEASGEWHIVYVGWNQTEILIQELTPGVEYEFQIRAVDSANPSHQGPFSASTFVTASGDLFAPSTPAAPVVASSRIAIQVVHVLGRNSGGVFNLEPDLAYLSVHVGGSADFFPDDTNMVGKLIANAGMIQAQIAAVGTFQIEQTDNIWVKVIAVDLAGNKSNASPAVQSTVLLIDDAHISDLTVSKVTAGIINAAWIIAGSIKTATSGARLELDADGLRAYKGNGVQTVGIDSDTGDVEILGRFVATGDQGAELSLEPTAGGDDPYMRMLPNNDFVVEGHVASFMSGTQTVTEISNVDQSTKVRAGGWMWVIHNPDGEGGIWIARNNDAHLIMSGGQTSLTSDSGGIVNLVAGDTHILMDDGGNVEIAVDGVVRFVGGASKPDVTGSAGGNAALWSLINCLVGMGIVSSSATF